MESIGVLTPEQARALWQDYQKRTQQTSLTNYPTVSRPTQHLQVKLKEALPVATDSLTEPSSAQAYVLVKNDAGDLLETTDEIEIINRFHFIDIDEGTYAKAEWIDGEWQLYAADCQGV